MGETKKVSQLEVKSLGFSELSQESYGSGEWEQEMNAFLDAQILKGTFFNDDWVFLVNDLVAEHFSSSPMCLKQDVMVDDELTTERVDQHPVYDLLDRPNPFQDYHSWQYNWAIEYNLMGNAFEWWNDDNSIALVVPAETVILDFDKKGDVAGYIVSRRMDELLSGKQSSNSARFGKDSIFHQMRPNPASLLYGLSPFLAPRKSILFNRYTQDYINGFYLKGATPGMVLEMENNISEEGALRLLRSFEANNTGRRNNRRTLLLPKGVSAKVVTPTIGDQRILELTEATQNKILAALKVPKHAFSLAESGSLGSEETKQALRFFYKSAIIPLQKKRAGFLTMKLRSRGFIEPNQYLEFDNSDVEYLQDDMIKKALLGKELLNQWTVNEIRQGIWDKEPVEGGDFVAALGSQNLSLGQEALTPRSMPVKSNEEDIGDDGPVSDDKLMSELQAARKAAFVTRYKDHFELCQKQMGREVDEKENAISEIVLNRFAQQLEEVFLPAVIEELEASPKENQKADSDRPTKLNVQRLKRRTKKRNRAYNAELGMGSIESYVEELEGTATRSYNTQIRPSFEPDKIDALNVLRDQDAEGRRTTLEARGLRAFQFVDETSINDVLNTVESGVQQRKTILEIANDIKEKFGEGAPGRATTIARTETLTAVSIGRAAAIDAIDEVFEDEKVFKLWLTADDDKVRDTHEPLDGQLKEVGKEFDNGLEYPREPGGPAGEVINCRCDVSAIPESELQFLDQSISSEFK